jgi:hypothetical protein
MEFWFDFAFCSMHFPVSCLGHYVGFHASSFSDGAGAFLV